MRHFHEFGKQVPPCHLRARRLVARFVEAPELLCIVPTQEVGEVLEEVFKGHQVVVLDMSVTSRCGLAGEIHAVELAHRAPRLIGLEGILGHFVDVLLLVVLAGETQVETNVGAYILRNEVDDLLRIGLVPHVYMNEPHRVLRVDGTAGLRSYAAN